jgi:hypothetical protein
MQGGNVVKRALFILGVCIISASASDQTWPGKISDSMCGAKHQKMAEHGTNNISDRDCTLACIKNGAQYVFVSKGKVYKISNHDYAGLQEHAGHIVALTGSPAGDTITVSKIAMESGHKKSD